MNEIWVLSIRSSLPNVCRSSKDLNVSVKAFDSFDKARDELRSFVKETAFSKNSMFDGKGNITYLKNYADDYEDIAYEDDPEVLDIVRINYVTDCLRDAFSGKDVIFEPESDYCTDWMIAIESEPGKLHLYGDNEGPCNGYDPVVMTNIFSMNEKKNYYLYIDDRFGQDDYTSELYIDLVKAEVK